MKKFILYYNPVSGNAAFRKKIDGFIEMFQALGTVLIPYRTTPGDNTEAFIRLTESVHADGILAAGGDGTFNQVVNICIKNGISIPIAVIGSGTSNDFAMSLGCTDLDDYAKRIVAGHTMKMDVGYANNDYFINVASAGMLTCIAHDVDHKWKNTIGKAEYYIKGVGELPKLHPIHLKVSADGSQEFDGSAYLFVIANNNAVAGMKNVAPRAEIDDGMLDLLILEKCSMLEFVNVFKDMFAGKLNPPRRGIRYIQASEFDISSDMNIGSDLDGEAGPKLPLKIKTIPRAIEIFC